MRTHYCRLLACSTAISSNPPVVATPPMQVPDVAEAKAMLIEIVRLLRLLVEQRLQSDPKTPAEKKPPRRAERKEEGPWTPRPFQQRILAALDGKAMHKRALAAEVGEGLFRAHGLTELRDRGLVLLDLVLGYYRPDSPPPGLEQPK